MEPGPVYGGLDDGRLPPGRRGRVPLVLSLHRSVEGLLCPCRLEATWVTIDGLDATEAAIGLVGEGLRACGSLGAVLLDTVVYAGFNLVEPWRLHGETGVPVIVVYHYPPDAGAVERALRLHFPDWEYRLSVLERVWESLRPAECPRGRLLYASYGLDPGEAWRLLCRLQVFTRTPEPLYAAHVAAGALSLAAARSSRG